MSRTSSHLLFGGGGVSSPRLMGAGDGMTILIQSVVGGGYCSSGVDPHSGEDAERWPLLVELGGNGDGVRHWWLLGGLKGGGINDSLLIRTHGCREDVVGQEGIPPSWVLALGINIPSSATCLS